MSKLTKSMFKNCVLIYHRGFGCLLTSILIFQQHIHQAYKFYDNMYVSIYSINDLKFFWLSNRTFPKNDVSFLYICINFTKIFQTLTDKTYY